MRKEKGFTLVELMVAITLVAIMVAIAVPTWGRWLPSYRLKGATRDVYSIFQKAKLEAVRRNVNVVISFDPDGDGTLDDNYKMFVDDGRGGGTADDFIQNGTELLLGNFTIPKKVTLVSTNFTGDAVGFNSRGLPANNQFGKATLSNTKGISREIIISMTGNIRINKP